MKTLLRSCRFMSLSLFDGVCAGVQTVEPRLSYLDGSSGIKFDKLQPHEQRSTIKERS